MRGFLASSIGVATAAALALPLALTTPAQAAESPSGAAPAVPAGSTQSLPLVPLGPSVDRSAGVPGLRAAPGLPETRGLTPHEVKRFSLVGVVWDDAGTELSGRVQVRTRSVATGAWSDWQDLETHNGEHAADPDAAERGSGRVRGSTAPLWVGESDGVEVRVQAEPAAPATRSAAPQQLPSGMRIELVDPGATAPVTVVDAKNGAAAAAGEPVPGGTTGATGTTGGSGGSGTADGSGTTGTTGTTGGSGGSGGSGTADGSGTTGTTGTADGSGTTGTTGTADGSGTTGGSATGATGGYGAAEGSEDPEGNGKGDVGDMATLPDMTMEVAEASSANVPLAALGATEITALDKADSTADAVLAGEGELTAASRPYIGPRPRIVTRKGWGADETLREKGFVYTGTVKAAFVHHTASGNNYACKDAPAILRGIYRYHVVSSGWRDIGYNFAVDKCGTVYEGRAGGVAKAVMGAHTMGFNSDSMGVAVIGTFTGTKPPAAAVSAVARLTAWKLGLFNRDPRAKTTLKSGGGNRFAKGTNVTMNVISGHRDGFATECPGRLLYGQLPPTRVSSAKLQGRP